MESGTSRNGNDSNRALLEVKPEPTAILSLMQSHHTPTQCSNVLENLDGSRNEKSIEDARNTLDFTSSSTDEELTTHKCFQTDAGVLECKCFERNDAVSKHTDSYNSEFLNKNFVKNHIKRDSKCIFDNHIEMDSMDLEVKETGRFHALTNIEECNIKEEHLDAVYDTMDDNAAESTNRNDFKHIFPEMLPEIPKSEFLNVVDGYKNEHISSMGSSENHLALAYRHKHTKIVDDARCHKCDICCKSFMAKSTLATHMQSHNNERNYKCNICTKRFKTKGNIMIHMQSHSNERNYTCDVCDKSFKRKDTVLRHMKTHNSKLAGSNTLDKWNENGEDNSIKMLDDIQIYEQPEQDAGEFQKQGLNRDQDEILDNQCEKMEKKAATNGSDCNYIFLPTKLEPAETLNLKTCSSSRRSKPEKSGVNSSSSNSATEVGCYTTPSEHKIDNTGRNHKCHVCTKSFKARSALMIHMNCHTNERNYKCNVCTKSFKTKANIMTHMQSHTKERNHICNICTKRFKTRSIYLQHMKCHTKEKNHKCNVCSKRFRTRNNMLEHMQSHSDERNYKCDICTKSFKTRNSMTEHTKYHTNERNFTCDICTKSFTRRSTMSNHMKCHTDERNHKCALCEKRFKTRSKMLDHMKCHTNERNHKCDVCSKSFKMKNTMMIHMKRHNNERNYKCNVCTKCFKSKRELFDHMTCHTDDRNHKCDVCTKGFKTRNNMLKHMKLHVNEGKHGCDICSEIFESKRRLVDHVKCHTNDRHYKCNICTKDFKKQNNLKKHMKTHNCAVKSKRVLKHHIEQDLEYMYDTFEEIDWKDPTLMQNEPRTLYKESDIEQCNIKEENLDFECDLLKKNVPKPVNETQIQRVLMDIKEDENMLVSPHVKQEGNTMTSTLFTGALVTDTDSAEVKQEIPNSNISENTDMNMSGRLSSHKYVKLETDDSNDVSDVN